MPVTWTLEKTSSGWIVKANGVTVPNITRTEIRSDQNDDGTETVKARILIELDDFTVTTS